MTKRKEKQNLNSFMEQQLPSPVDICIMEETFNYLQAIGVNKDSEEELMKHSLLFAVKVLSANTIKVYYKDDPVLKIVQTNLFEDKNYTISCSVERLYEN